MDGYNVCFSASTLFALFMAMSRFVDRMSNDASA